MTKPFNVESAHINMLSDIQLTQLLKNLLHAEAYRFGLAQSAVEVSLNITTGDGGEDGRISWEHGPESTDYFPSRFTVFQNKATKMANAAYGKEILAKDGTVKPLVDDVLKSGGSYVVFTTQLLNPKQKKPRIKSIRDTLENLGMEYAAKCDLRIYDANQIAGWVNQYVPAIVGVLHWIGRPIERGLKTFDLWAEHEDLSRLPFSPVESRGGLILKLRSDLPIPKSCFRVMGLSGLGKTRTAFQVFAENDEIKNLMIYVDANHAPNIDALVADWISLNFKAILVVDNCDYRLHERLVKEVRRDNSQISLLSLDYNFETVPAPTMPFTLKQLSDEELLQLLSPVYKDQLPDLNRIVSFAQGFPQMAVLLAEARLNEDPRIGELTDDELASKLLWCRGEVENPDYLNILQICSLFDVFGIEKDVESQLKYIADIAGLDIDAVYGCVQQYSERGLIDRRGRFGQLVPKPLAIRLAGQWWAKSRAIKQRELIDGIPESMVDGFCHQVEKMDFHPNVKLLTEQLCGPQGPFGQAEVILSNRGSRLFRAFVNVNPEATSAALYRTLNICSDEKLLAIDEDIRRNLVWALERLCFHAHLFDESAWCMLLLASAENETWSNNATGMFTQLFRINLSGTAAVPRQRFALLQRALDLNRAEIDLIVLKALEQAIRVYGGSRTVGAEYQGTKVPLEEWRPTIWQEIFDYWQVVFDLLLLLMERGDVRKIIAVRVIGNNIRGLVSRGRIDMLDTAIKKVIQLNGRYWPEALESIKNTFEYDSKGLKQEAVDALKAWLALLNPEDASLADKLKILVIDPPWEHHKDDDGQYIDVAADNAKTLAVEIAKNIHSLFPYLGLLTQGGQKQSYIFGKQLAIELPDSVELLKLVLEQLAVTTQSPNASLALGIYSGIHEKSDAIWQAWIDKLLEDKRLIALYPEFIRTGKIKKSHLVKLIELIRSGIVPANGANALSYGGVTDTIDSLTIAEFCIELSSLGTEAAWSALNVIFMYCFSNKERVVQIRDSLKALIVSVPLHSDQDQSKNSRDFYHWHEMAQIILKVPDQDFAVSLANQLMAACRYGFDHGNVWSYIKPLLTDLMQEYGEVLWPIFGDAIEKAEGMELYWLQQLLDRENSFTSEKPSVLSVLPPDRIISWCLKNPDRGPNFIASCINVLETVEDALQPTELFISLLENFGDDGRVVSTLNANMGTRGWSGSLVPYLEADKKALYPLLKHGNPNVRRWVKEHIAQIDKQIEYESARDDERNLGIY